MLFCGLHNSYETFACSSSNFDSDRGRYVILLSTFFAMFSLYQYQYTDMEITVQNLYPSYWCLMCLGFTEYVILSLLSLSFHKTIMLCGPIFELSLHTDVGA